MNKAKEKTQRRRRRQNRIRAKVSGTAERPRLSIFKSNKYLSAQLIDDDKAVTLVASTSAKTSGKTTAEKAKNVGLEIAKQASAKKINSVIFDRGGYFYTGNVAALAEGAREGGLKF